MKHYFIFWLVSPETTNENERESQSTDVFGSDIGMKKYEQYNCLSTYVVGISLKNYSNDILRRNIAMIFW
jgi:hypothetical protein